MTIFNKTCSKFAEYFQFIYVKPDCNIAAKSKHMKDIKDNLILLNDIF